MLFEIRTQYCFVIFWLYFKKMYYWFCRGRRRGFEEAGHLFGSLFQYAAWPLNFDPCSLLSHPHPARIHHTSGLLWQRSPLTFLRHLHLLLIKWTGSDPEYQWCPTGGNDISQNVHLSDYMIRLLLPQPLSFCIYAHGRLFHSKRPTCHPWDGTHDPSAANSLLYQLNYRISHQRNAGASQIIFVHL